MSRWVVLFFTLLLPFQLVWTSAVAYCQHETGAVVVAHFGHHPHAHEEAVSDRASADNSAHGDCNVCNAASAPLLPGSHPSGLGEALVLRQRLPDTGPLASTVSRAPDRPQWRRLV